MFRHFIIAALLVSGILQPVFGDWEVDSVTAGGITPAIALDPSGGPSILHGNPSSGSAWLAWWAGTGWNTDPVYQPEYGSCGWFDLVIDLNDVGHASFGGTAVGGAGYALQSGSPSGWDVEFLPVNGKWTSLDLDSQGRPCIAIVDTDEDNRFFRLDGSQWLNELIDAGDDNWASISLSMDSQDRAHVAYNSSSTSTCVRYALRDQSGQWTLSVVDSTLASEPRGISLALSGNDMPRISYNSAGEVRYAAWDGDSWNVETVYSVDTGAWELDTSLALDSWGCPHIAHYDSSTLSLLYSSNDGTGWQTETVFESASGNADLVLDDLNRPHMAFTSGSQLMYAHDPESMGAGHQGNEGGAMSLGCSPNPARGAVEFSFTLEGSAVELRVFDLQGRQVAAPHSGESAAGLNTVLWVPEDGLPSGEYLVVMTAPNGMVCERLVLLR